MIYLRPHCTLKSYSAAVKGSVSVVKIEIEVRDHTELSFLLGDLAEIEKEQKAAKAAEAISKSKKPKVLALPAPLLQIADHRENRG